MKKILLLATIAFLISTCSTNHKNPINKPEVVYDTTKRGVAGKPDSYFKVDIKKGNLDLGWFDKYWDEKGRLEERYHIYDSKGRDSVGRFFMLWSDTYQKSYQWSDTVKNNVLDDSSGWRRILMIDSTYTLDGKTLKEISYSFYTDRKIHQAPLLPEIEVTLFLRNGKINKKQINDFFNSRMYEESNDSYYERDTSLPLGYSEWNEISRSYFGEAMRDALVAKDKSFRKALQRDKNVVKHRIIF